MLKSSVTSSLQMLLNQALALDPNTEQRLKPLAECAVRFNIQPIDYQFYFHIKDNQIVLLDNYQGIVACSISATPVTFVKLFNNNRQQLSELINQNAITFEGDMTVAQQFQRLFTDLKIDWEQQLAKITGDLAAHHLNKFWQQSEEFTRQLFNTFETTISDYIQEEARLTPTLEEIDEFNQEVNLLNLRVERLTAKMMNYD